MYVGIQDKEQQTQINREAAVNIASAFNCSSTITKSAKNKVNLSILPSCFPSRELQDLGSIWSSPVSM